MTQSSKKTRFEWQSNRLIEIPSNDAPLGEGPIVSTDHWMFLREGALSGFWTSKTETGFIGGWGPARSHVVAAPGATVGLDTKSLGARQFLLSLPATGIQCLIDVHDLRGKNVSLFGKGPLATLTKALLEQNCNLSLGTVSAADSRIVVDVGSGLDELAANGSNVAKGARYIKIVEPDVEPLEIDFYPNIHKRSLNFTAMSLFRPDVRVTPLKLRKLDDLTGDILAQISDGTPSQWLSYSRADGEA